MSTPPSSLLAIQGGAANASITTASDLHRLADVTFTGHKPDLDITADTVRITYPLLHLPSARARSVAIVLHAGHAWSVEINGGAGEVQANLDATTIQSLHIDGGVAKTTLRLPRPSGAVPLVIAGGASDLDIHLPEGTAFSLDGRRGVTDLTLDSQHLSAVGGHYHFETPGLVDSDDHYRIAVGGGASGLSVTSGRSGAPHR
jgi:hypothetical protein